MTSAGSSIVSKLPAPEAASLTSRVMRMSTIRWRMRLGISTPMKFWPARMRATLSSSKVCSVPGRPRAAPVTTTGSRAGGRPAGPARAGGSGRWRVGEVHRAVVQAHALLEHVGEEQARARGSCRRRHRPGRAACGTSERRAARPVPRGCRRGCCDGGCGRVRRGSRRRRRCRSEAEAGRVQAAQGLVERATSSAPSGGW